MTAAEATGAATKGGAGHGQKKNNSIGIKETLTSLIIAFMLAFLFRGFVVEGFVIPTGSMAPTLLGKHLRMQGEQSGYDWAVGPWTYQTRARRNPVRTQTGIEVQDPMSGLRITDTNRRLAAGDRVFVLKYLPLLHHPERWDVVVFKNPGTNENYIKRLIGLPGEQVAIVDGDIFARPFKEGETLRSGWGSWEQKDWAVQRKSERTQRAMLQDVFDSRYAPIDVPEYRSPLSGLSGGWSGLGSGGEYSYAGGEKTSLSWNGLRPLTDMHAYNQIVKSIDLFQRSDDPLGRSPFGPFPDADLALSLNVQNEGAATRVSPVIDARGLELRAVVDTGTGRASVEMRDASVPDSPWTVLDEGDFTPVAEGGWTRIEFWHMDQALWLFVDDTLVCGGADKGGYEMTPAQRAAAATGRSWGELENDPSAGDGINTRGVLGDRLIYKAPTFRWDFEGGAFKVSNVRVRRDIAYQTNANKPTRGGHPMNFPTMNDEQYFMCGDNSANSHDSRLWGGNEIQSWIRQEIDDTPGMVNRDLIVGKAFVVYFPAPLDTGPILTPDFGRVRWIW